MAEKNSDKRVALYLRIYCSSEQLQRPSCNPRPNFGEVICHPTNDNGKKGLRREKEGRKEGRGAAACAVKTFSSASQREAARRPQTAQCVLARVRLRAKMSQGRGTEGISIELAFILEGSAVIVTAVRVSIGYSDGFFQPQNGKMSMTVET